MISAGLLMYRVVENALEVFLAHPGGPFFSRKDAGAWTIPKGEAVPEEPLLQAAIREFGEETSLIARPPYVPLGSVKLKSGKIVHAWAFAGHEKGAPEIRSNTFELEWPPHSGKKAMFPEVDRAAFFSLAAAKEKLTAAQWPFIERLREALEK